MSIPHINTAWFIGLCISTAFVILYPLVLALIARIRLGVKWRYFWYGALIFFVLQMVIRIPLVIWIQGLIAPQLAKSVPLQVVWVAILAITAGLFEEIGRYIGYRWLMRREVKTWNKGVMYGIGHGGLESMLFVGGQLLLTLINIIVISTISFNTLPAAQQATLTQQITQINAQPAWISLLGGWERLWTVPFHIAMSVVVLQVFRRQNILWLWLAVLLHTLLDFVSAIIPLALGQSITTSLIVEGVVAVAGIASIWAIFRLRTLPRTDSEDEEDAAPPEVTGAAAPSDEEPRSTDTTAMSSEE